MLFLVITTSAVPCAAELFVSIFIHLKLHVYLRSPKLNYLIHINKRRINCSDLAVCVQYGQELYIKLLAWRSLNTHLKCSVYDRAPSQQTRVHPVLLQYWPTVKDGWPTLKQHWVNASCSLDFSIVATSSFSTIILHQQRTLLHLI